MKGTLLYMIQSLYGVERKVRVRPSYFPFTEPSFEFDVTCGICNGMGCKSCGHKGWLEVGGCGMVHPQVLRNGGIDPAECNGYAGGFGIERMAMLKHDVDDIRLFYESDLRFLEQFYGPPPKAPRKCQGRRRAPPGAPRGLTRRGWRARPTRHPAHWSRSPCRRRRCRTGRWSRT